jgi:branched-chain amino acid transport system permease protein
VSLGHAAFLGIGAYVTVLAAGDSGGSVARVLPLAVLAAAGYALFVGALSLRTKGVYFIMVTLAFAQMAYFVFHDTKLAGGSDGMFLYAKPSLAAFVIAGALAGVAGFLLAVKDGAVNPELLSWHESGAVLLMLILGGIGHLRGAVLGAIAFTLLKELFQLDALLGPLASHWQLTLGFTIIAFVALLPKGLIGLRARFAGVAHG